MTLFSKHRRGPSARVSTKSLTRLNIQNKFTLSTNSLSSLEQGLDFKVPQYNSIALHVGKSCRIKCVLLFVDLRCKITGHGKVCSEGRGVKNRSVCCCHRLKLKKSGRKRRSILLFLCVCACVSPLGRCKRKI